MNKKVILLIILVLLLCGCSSEVNLNIDGKNITEEVNINYMADSSITKKDIYASFREYIPAFNDVLVVDMQEDIKDEGVKYYERKINEYNNGYLFNYKYTFNTNNYKNARSVKNAFKSLNINDNKNDNTVIISSDNAGIILLRKYPRLTSVTVNITTNNQVLETNGVKNGSKYSWTFTQQDNNKGIYIKMKVKDNNIKNDEVTVQIPTDIKEESWLAKFFNEHKTLVLIFSIIIFVLVLLIVNKLSRIKYE